MEIIKFLDKTWREIPEQDNPAMHSYDGIIEECLMIFKGNYPRISNGGFVVAKVEPDTDITMLGVFWLQENADLFAKAVASQHW